MRGRDRGGVVAGVLVMLVTSLVDARPVTLRDKAKLRAGASAATELLGEVPAGTRVEVIAEEGGWRQVQTPEGQTGYLWAEHLLGEDARGAGAPTRPDAASAPVDDLRALRADVTVLRERPEPATAADLEHLREDIQRLVTTQEGLLRRLEHQTATEPGPETNIGATPILLVIAAVCGWVLSRLTVRRRDHRQRDRLHF